jgi:hypothetical protein
MGGELRVGNNYRERYCPGRFHRGVTASATIPWVNIGRAVSLFVYNTLHFIGRCV